MIIFILRGWRGTPYLAFSSTGVIGTPVSMIRLIKQILEGIMFTILHGQAEFLLQRNLQTT